jgi:putative membrane-bound dehydrogenase-like protein
MHRWSVLAVLLTIGVASAARADGPIPANEAPGHMTVPAGFHVSLFAGEPDVVQPIAFTLDDRGRMWVVENFSYPNWIRDGKPGHDRIVILDDPHNTGHFTEKKVFADNLANVSGVEIGFGGVWVCATPNLLFIPLDEQADKPAGPTQVLLDGWSLDAKHNVFNQLRWGPDGWLYGCNGILATSMVGKPGAPNEQRTPMNCGVWRYHPTRHMFEVFAWGTTNPWGLDWDDYGQMFITNCVIKHLWHVVQGAHYQRMYGVDLNPNVYNLMESCADHIHWAGGDWTTSRTGAENAKAGGGHAHAGCMVYLGDNWPAEYRNSVFMCNIHGNRVNHDTLEHKGSGYVAHHGPDFLLANDPWFRGLNLAYGPDGGVYVSDWCDTGECHNYDHVDQSNGRIYKVTYGDVKLANSDLSQWTDAQLVAAQLHPNDWFVRHARRILQERAADGKLEPQTAEGLQKILNGNFAVPRKLRALWALHDTSALGEAELLGGPLNSPEPFVRGWAIQLALEPGQGSDALVSKLTEMAGSDPSPVVRLYLASGLQRLPVQQRWGIATALCAHAEDASDPNIPLMLWYGIEPLAAADHDRAADLLTRCKIPIVRESIARRIAQ